MTRNNLPANAALNKLDQHNRADIDVIITDGLPNHTHVATENVVKSITLTTATLNYLDHSSAPQTMTVVTGITINTVNVVNGSGAVS